MERVFECTLFGEPHKFKFTAGVLYDAMDKYAKRIEEILALKGREKLEAVCYLATEMSKEAGDNKTFDPNAIEWNRAIPLETAVVMAVNIGTFRDYPPKIVNKTLEKIEKKKEHAKPVRTFLSRLFRGWGLVKKSPTTQPPA